MKRIVIFIFFVSLIFTGCITPRWVKKKFKYCFTGENTGLDTLININGYYVPSLDNPTYRWNNKIVPIDTLHSIYVFYNNGFVLYTAVNCFNKNTKVPFWEKRWLGEPGGYVLHGDTIKLQYIDYAPSGQVMWGMVEIWFKIIDKNTIERIDAGADNPLPSYVERIFIFKPFEINIKPEDTWIYNKSWFRCKKK